MLGHILLMSGGDIDGLVRATTSTQTGLEVSHELKQHQYYQSGSAQQVHAFALVDVHACRPHDFPIFQLC